MSLKVTVLTAASIVCAFTASQAWAESAERSLDNRVNSGNSLGVQKFFGKEPTGVNKLDASQTKSVVGSKTLNIAQPSTSSNVRSNIRQPQVETAPQQPVTQPGQVIVRLPDPKTNATPAKTKRVKRKARKKKNRISEKRWWEKHGNPKVFAFRDCIAVYARAQAQEIPKLNLKSVVSKAIKSECSGTFAEMSATLRSRFGKSKSRRLARELTGSTFVPAVRKAVLTVREEQKLAAAQTETVPVPSPQPAAAPAANAANTVPAPVPVSGEVSVELAKEEMFGCYRDASDRMSANTTASIDLVVDQVLIDCSGNTKAFFTKLFALHPQPVKVQTERMRKAISEQYRPAIAKRIAAQRQAGVSVSKKVTSTAQ